MSVSRCCKDNLIVMGTSEGAHYYSCVKCRMPTDPVVYASELKENEIDGLSSSD